MATAKLTDEEAMRIIQLAIEGNLDVRQEADYHNTNFETIRRIARRETYRHLWTQAGDRRDVKTESRGLDEAKADEAALASARLLQEMLGMPEVEEKIGFIE